MQSDISLEGSTVAEKVTFETISDRLSRDSEVRANLEKVKFKTWR